MDKSQAVLENILSRTSVRAYTSEKVSEEQIDAMLRAAMAAPSSKNRQPAEYIVVQDRSMLDSLASGLRYAKMLAGAPLAIIICARTEFINRDGQPEHNRFWEQDAAAACENLLLAAHALGLGAVWTAASDPERCAVVKELMEIGDEAMPLAVVAIGHPAENPAPKNKWKPEKIHREKW